VKPTWISIAKRPKWIAVLIAMLLVAAGFAALAQWQLERTFTTVGIAESELPEVPIEELVTVAQPPAQDSLDRLAEFEAKIDYGNLFIVSNRKQLTDSELISGYWLIANSELQFEGEEQSLTLALGFSEELQEIERVRSSLLNQESQTERIIGYVEPTEAPIGRDGNVFESLSLAQLVNIYFDQPTPHLPVFVIIQQGPIPDDLERISIDILDERVEINWLTAFYAIEWIIFALFALYFWYRLVADDRMREIEAQRDLD
jgi:cytochrome oxidase assembly protein ShyY1